MKVHCQVLTTPAADSPGTTLLLHFDSKRYIIGQLGEGAQRAFTERSARLKKVSNVFLTGRTQLRSTGGLVGVLLTMGDKEEGKLLEAAKGNKPAQESMGMTVHGGENLMHTLATTRPFVFRKAMKLGISEIPQLLVSEEPLPTRRPYFADENITVRAMHIFPDGHKKTEVAEPSQREPSSTGGDNSVDEDRRRKRSFKDFSEKEKFQEAQKARDRMAVLQTVVGNMFCSNWTMDSMVEDPTETSAGCPVNENDMMDSANRNSSLTKRHRGPSSVNSTTPTHTTEHEPQLSTRLPPPGKTRSPWPASTVTHLPRSEPSTIALSYIITLHPMRGKFLPMKAIALGIKPGPDFSRMCNGECLTVAGGRVVRPDEVMEPTRPGTGFAVCDLPDITYINDFLAREEWRDVERLKIEVGCFFWILGEGIIADERLEKFMEDMAHARHVVSSPDVCPNIITFNGAAKAAVQLSLMDEGFFPIPHASSVAPGGCLDGIEPAIPGLVWQVEPKWELQKGRVEEPFSVERALAETEPEYAKLAKAVKMQTLQDAVETSENIPWKDVEIITLGTGSALPSKYRNVSATLVRVPGSGSVFFDCGESSIGQLRRLYQPTELVEVLRDLKAIYISHLHADHHLGTAAVLKAWYNEVYLSNGATNESRIMNIVAPWKFQVWLREYADVEEFGFSKIRFVACGDILLKAREQGGDLSINTTISKLPDVLSSMSLTDIQTSHAVHCQGSFVTAWTWENGFKFAYSGDTRPTPGFVKIGKDATVLLHEATFDDELMTEAIAKKHSTTSEALMAGRDMGAKGVILTHFSQRYPKLPVLLTDGECDGIDIVLAFDLCRVRVGDIGRFAGFLPALRELYKYEEEEVEEPEDEEVEEVIEVKNKKPGKVKKEMVKP